jgi:hypothetical protein
MDAQNEAPPLDAAGLGNMSLPGGIDSSENAPKTAHLQEAINDLKREFISECLRITAIKAAHGATNVAIGDDLNAELDIRLAIENLREAARAFREIKARMAEAGQ